MRWPRIWWPLACWMWGLALCPLAHGGGERAITVMSFQTGVLRSPKEAAQDPAYRRKLAHLREVILSLEGGLGADVVGLQGIGERVAVEDLILSINRALGPLRASYVTWLTGESAGEEVLRVALLSKFPLVTFHNYFPWPEGPSMLHAVLDARGSPLHVILNAWHPGTDDRAIRIRRMQAMWCRRLAERILESERDARLVVMGDFQATFRSLWMRYLEQGLSEGGPQLWSLSSEIAGEADQEPAQLDFMDHILVSEPLRGRGELSRSGEEGAGRTVGEEIMPGEHPAVWVRCPMESGSQ